MVTLLGFFFILSNVICLEIWMPDLVGPVRYIISGAIQGQTLISRVVPGAFMVVL